MSRKIQLLDKLRTALNVDCENECILHCFSKLFEKTSFGVHSVTMDGDIIYSNDHFANLFGYKDSNDLIASEFNMKTIYKDINERELLLSKLVKQNYVECDTTFLNHKNGTQFQVKYCVILINDILYGIMSDISKEKEYVEALKRAIGLLENAEKKLNISTKYSKEVIISTVQTLSKMGEIKDPYTYGHQMRVKDLCLEMGKVFKLTAGQMDALEIASMLHDIGKFYTPTEILVRPGKLTDHEMSFIKLHSEIGAKIVEAIPFETDPPIYEIIHQHHERMDGTGYPLGLKGNDIHFLARIIVVADMVEAICNHRPYRPGLGMDKAIEILMSERGTKLDDDVVDVCLYVLNNGFKFSQY